MARPFRSPHSTTLGHGPTVLFVLFPAFVAAGTYPMVFVSNLISANWAHLVSNLFLIAGLGVAYLVWRIVACGGRLTPASGLGFAAAGYGLGQRVFCEFVMSFFGEPARAVWPESNFGDLVAFTRISGLIAFVFGLAMVLAASLWERRLAREAPRWVRPR